MNMYRRFTARDFIVFALLVMGILSAFVQHPAPFIIPILVFGSIYLLYKFPPNRWRGGTRKSAAQREAQYRQRERDRKKSNFRVIYGNKPNQEDEPPRYH